MAELVQTVLQVVQHILIRHPQLAGAIETMAAKAQGKSPEDMKNFEEWRRGQGLSLQQIFSRIYDEGHWGQSDDPRLRFYSGPGSHDPDALNAYVLAIQSFAAEIGAPVSALDLGCGDFNIGSRIRPSFSDYTACDIVPQLIEANRSLYADHGVDFRCIDFTREQIPRADVIFVRQVLQHLSNLDIAAFVRAISGRCKYLVVTEHLPQDLDFVPNLNKPAGGDIRLGIGSGVVLTAAPFNLGVISARQICSVPEGGGQIVTMVYTLP